MPEQLLPKRIFSFLGSIKFAIPLLATITGILIWATFYESQVGSTVVQQAVYKSPWFGALMFLLAMNLATSALTRYPWRGTRKIGFALTHLGLVVIIAGSAAVIHVGVEGMLLVRTDSPANNQIRLEGNLIEVLTPQQEFQEAEVVVHPDGRVTPSQVGTLSLQNYGENTMKTVRFQPGATVKNPAAKLILTSERMGQNLERWLGVAPKTYSEVNVGPATLEIIQTDSEAQLQQLLATPKQSEIITTEPNAYFRLLVAPTGELFYAAKSSRSFHSDPISVGEKVQSGWADFAITLADYIPDGQLNRQIVPIANSEFAGKPALQVQTEDGTQTWIQWGEPTAINTEKGEVFAAFTPKFQQLPFAIKLEDFIVERNEGSESVAMWTSKIKLFDFKNEVVINRDVWMNHPTWYQGWKIAQASWNPGDLSQSTLQVKREPLWVTALTWTGSSLVIMGISTMFYGRAIAKKLKQIPLNSEPETPLEPQLSSANN